MVKNRYNVDWGRFRHIDTLKGIGIILMVGGHGNAPFSHFIGLFHMAIFFIASGYLWDDRNVEDIESCRKYIIRKFRTLWLPYVLCNVAFVLMNNLFLYVGIYTDNPTFLDLQIGSLDCLATRLGVLQL